MEFFKSFFRALFFGDASVLVKEGKRKILFEDDLLPMPEWLNPRRSPLNVSEIRWESGKKLAWSLLRTCRRGLSKAYGAYGLAVLVGLMQPLLVNKFVGSISAGFEDSANFRFALICALLLGVSAVVRGVSFQHFFFQTLKQYQLIVNVINERLFRHSLRMTQQARMRIPVGDVVNHMGSDSETVADFSMVFADLIFTAVTVVSVIGMLFHYIGWSAVLPLILLAFLAPATSLLAKRFSHLDEIMMKERDHRVTLMGQILNAIRVVKYFAWEKSVFKEVHDVRHRELHARRRMARSESFAGVAYVAVSSVVLFVALGIHVMRGFPLDPALVFTLVALFGL
ncbi:MAG TPA: ABC transporter transmembrane domain-containing protein, partial [Pseudobdellovibrionaceae bacterium]|nr:ABC transporter transmembrane domain-containing protein [Pseudobdellovibrionaceae bacterium]